MGSKPQSNECVLFRSWAVGCFEVWFGRTWLLVEPLLFVLVAGVSREASLLGTMGKVDLGTGERSQRWAYACAGVRLHV